MIFTTILCALAACVSAFDLQSYYDPFLVGKTSATILVPDITSPTAFFLGFGKGLNTYILDDSNVKDYKLGGVATPVDFSLAVAESVEKFKFIGLTGGAGSIWDAFLVSKPTGGLFSMGLKAPSVAYVESLLASQSIAPIAEFTVFGFPALQFGVPEMRFAYFDMPWGVLEVSYAQRPTLELPFLPGTFDIDDPAQCVSAAGKTVVVTGASSGIGYKTAEFFAQKGAIVYDVSLDDAVPDGVTHIQCRLNETFWTKPCKDKLVRDLGVSNVDVLVLNAGVGSLNDFHDITADEFADIFKVNLFGNFDFYKRLWEGGNLRGDVKVVWVSSGAADFPLAFSVPYNLVKLAIKEMVTGILPIESPNIKHMVIVPDTTDTDFVPHAFTNVYESCPGRIKAIRQMVSAMLALAGQDPERLALAIYQATCQTVAPGYIVHSVSDFFSGKTGYPFPYPIVEYLYGDMTPQDWVTVIGNNLVRAPLPNGWPNPMNPDIPCELFPE